MQLQKLQMQNVFFHKLLFLTVSFLYTIAFLETVENNSFIQGHKIELLNAYEFVFLLFSQESVYIEMSPNFVQKEQLT